jgi:hypothetical protein
MLLRIQNRTLNYAGSSTICLSKMCRACMLRSLMELGMSMLSMMVFRTNDVYLPKNSRSPADQDDLMEDATTLCHRRGCNDGSTPASMMKGYIQYLLLHSYHPSSTHCCGGAACPRTQLFAFSANRSDGSARQFESTGIDILPLRAGQRSTQHASTRTCSVHEKDSGSIHSFAAGGKYGARYDDSSHSTKLIAPSTTCPYH